MVTQDPLKEKRWTEIKFYFIILDILNIRKNMLDVMDLIDNLAIFGQYSPEQLKPIAQEVISSIRFRPGKEEFITLASEKMPVTAIKKRANLHNRIYYNIINKEKEDPRMYYPRLNDSKLEVIELFLKAFENIKEVGLWLMNNTKKCGEYSKT